MGVFMRTAIDDSLLDRTRNSLDERAEDAAPALLATQVDVGCLPCVAEAIELLCRGEIHALRRYLLAVPAPTLHRDARLYLLSICVRYLLSGTENEADATWALSEMDADVLVPVGPSNTIAMSGKGEWLMATAFRALAAGDINTAMNHLEFATTLLQPDTPLHAIAATATALGLAMQGAHEAAREILLPYVACDPRQSGAWGFAMAAFGVSAIHVAQGQLSAGADFCKLALHRLKNTELGICPISGILKMQLAEIACIENRLGDAKQLVLDALSLFNQGGLHFFTGYGAALRCRIRSINGEKPNARESAIEFGQLYAWKALGWRFAPTGVSLAVLCSSGVRHMQRRRQCTSVQAEAASTPMARRGGAVAGTEAMLTSKENAVAQQLTLGLSNKEIARSLYLSTNTVKMHLKNLYRKLGVTKRYEAIRKYAALR